MYSKVSDPQALRGLNLRVVDTSNHEQLRQLWSNAPDGQEEITRSSSHFATPIVRIDSGNKWLVWFDRNLEDKASFSVCQCVSRPSTSIIAKWIEGASRMVYDNVIDFAKEHRFSEPRPVLNSQSNEEDNVEDGLAPVPLYRRELIYRLVMATAIVSGQSVHAVRFKITRMDSFPTAFVSIQTKDVIAWLVLFPALYGSLTFVKALQFVSLAQTVLPEVLSAQNCKLLADGQWRFRITAHRKWLSTI
ncbi:hypothetical protein BD410DRAFT_799261 [Rickenella mellea]|uniref:Uncharacterized protein n=1 Tax=Rickenella mellea TaxID=50990 RepID=A0A4Y7QJM2_9AGAM|nr:hypothetical protein BD410DRAFT_799261 [Rickenella mellea]